MNAYLKKSAIVAAACAFTAVPAIASAVTVSPGGSITASGQTELTAGGQEVSCTTTLTGNVTTNGAVTINSASFAAGDAACALIQADNLPWTGSFDADAQGITLNGVDVGIPLLSVQCGPASINPGYSNAPSTVHFDDTALGSCSVDGELSVTPGQTAQQ